MNIVEQHRSGRPSARGLRCSSGLVQRYRHEIERPDQVIGQDGARTMPVETAHLSKGYGIDLAFRVSNHHPNGHQRLGLKRLDPQADALRVFRERYSSLFAGHGNQVHDLVQIQVREVVAEPCDLGERLGFQCQELHAHTAE